MGKESKPEVLDSAASIGFRYLGDSSYSFRVEALIRVNYVPRVITINHMDIDAFAEAIGMNRIITAREGDYWRSSILVANKSEQQHIAFHRMGVLNGVVLEFILFFQNEGEEGMIKVITLDEQNVLGQMSGLMVGKSLGEEMISIFQEVSQTLEIFGEREQSFSYMMVDPPNNSKIFRPSKN